ncbi:uncharacterized protein LOC110099438 isoform X4 [Dendrobium catenatum]|uniref:uncharacterized protein LOC110099438 isoform X4 n=1 Tax=Dendrobium catenatum TaxID=906689 RepID=UPI0010A0B682|nr:uncharacterized protein LOC110099438 isoform X4 [Dendrobium catenatum]
MAFRTALRPVLVLTEPWSSAHRPVLTVSLPAQLIRPRVRVSTFAPFMRCSRSDVPSPAFSQDEQDPPQEAVLKVISEVSKSEGRVSQTTNVIIGGTVKDDATNEWLALDQKDRVTHKLSSRGKYVSVNIGPIRVVSSEQVQAVYNAMRRDERMKYFL